MPVTVNWLRSDERFILYEFKDPWEIADYLVAQEKVDAMIRVP